MIRDDFAIFILSHERADNVKTVSLLKKCNYTGKWYIIIDNCDSQANKYYDNFGKDHIIMFDKISEVKNSDTMDQLDSNNIVLFARNTCFDIAKNIGIKYFLELDDDYDEIRCRYEKDGILRSFFIRDLDYIVEPYIEFLDSSGALTVALTQSGDFIGGKGSMVFKKRVVRKAMNAFFCTTDRPFKFLGRLNEDVNMYCLLGSMGLKIFSTADVSINQSLTQQNSGGLTDAYLNLGTYIKSFYSVMCCPSFVKVYEIGHKFKRFHHLVNWENATPKIISNRFKKI